MFCLETFVIAKEPMGNETENLLFATISIFFGAADSFLSSSQFIIPSHV